MRTLIKITTLCLAILLASCADKQKKDDKSAAAKLKVFASNYPLKYFVEQLAGDDIDLYYPLPKDIDPAYWKPEEKEIQQLQSVDLIILNGAGYEKWLSGTSLPKNKIINTSIPFKDHFIYETNTAKHTHGNGKAHTHSSLAFTTWLDFNQSQQQLEVIKKSLVALLPNKESQIQKNYERVNGQLKQLDSLAKKVFSNAKNSLFYGSHPVYQYLARAYHVNIISFHWEPDEYPSAAEWHKLEHSIHSKITRKMLWEDAPTLETKNRLDDLGIETVEFYPCANLPSDTTDFLDVMKINLSRINR